MNSGCSSAQVMKFKERFMASWGLTIIVVLWFEY